MRIGILTFHRSINNGAIIQCFALSSILSKAFEEHEVEVIDYQMEKVDKSYQPTFRTYLSGGSLPGKIKRIVKYALYPEMFDDAMKKYHIFQESLSNLPLSTFHIIDDSFDELNNYINENIDLLIVGSDAVWNYSTRGFPNAYFPGTDLSCQKMSYAASCYGMDFLTCSEADRKEIQKRLNDFSYIGVRDKATFEFVKWSGCSIEPTYTCDPTLCLDIDSLPVDVDTLNAKLSNRGFDFDKKTIAVMGNNDMTNMVRNMFGNDYQIVSLFNRTKGADVQLFDISPFEWAYVFRYFSLTVTTFFHGTMLSLRNGVPVICIALDTDFSKKHTPKVLDALERLGMSDWYFHTDYKHKNAEAIKTKAKELLASDLKQAILAAVDDEAKSIVHFIDFINNDTKEKKLND